MTPPPPPESNDDRMENLLSDLRSLRRVAAPEDFTARLREKLPEQARAVIPLWKRFFAPRLDGVYRVPALAYGSLALIAVCVIGYYALWETDFPAEPNRPVQEEEYRPSTEGPAPATEQAQPLPDERTTGAAGRQSGASSERSAGTRHSNDAVSTNRPETTPPAPPAEPAPSAAPLLPMEKDQAPERGNAAKRGVTVPSMRQKSVIQQMEMREDAPSLQVGGETREKKEDREMNELDLNVRGIVLPLSEEEGVRDSLSRLDSLARRDTASVPAKPPRSEPKK